jgi:6-phosphogluconolactonase (cycloisomerase 2 family)
MVFRIILVSLGAGLIGCGGGGSSNASGSNPVPVSLQTIIVTAPNASVAAGLTQQFTATGKFSDGSTKAFTNVTWSTSDSTVATINSAGLLTSFKQGAVTVSATSGSITGSSPFTIGPPVPSNLTISPASVSVVVGSGDLAKLSALLVFTDGSRQDVSNQASWSSTNTSTATVDAHGNATAIHTGYTKIGATNGTFSAAADFAVVALPRFLYIPSYVRLVSRATVEPGTGKLRQAGYVQTPSSDGSRVPVSRCPTADPSNKFLYIGSTLTVIATGSTTGEIDGYTIDQTTGTLTPLASGPMTIADPITCIQFEPTGKFGYATSSNLTTDLVSFSQDPNTGVLTQIGSITLNNPPTGVAIDPLGKYLFTATVPFTNPPTAPAQAYGYAIDPATGALKPIPGTPFQLSTLTGGFSWHPSGNFLYMANAGGLSIDVYSVDRTTGKATPGSSTTTCINPSSIVFSPDGEFAYTSCSMDAAHHPDSASVETFAVGSNGALTHLGSAHSPNIPMGLQMDPSGKFLYLSSIAPYLYTLQIGADGVASVAFKQGIKTNSAFTFAITSGSSAVQYTPKFAYIAASGASATSAGTLSTYPVAPDGKLGSTLGTIGTQPSPFSLSSAPWGSNLLLTSAAAFNELEAFPLSSTGAPGAPDFFGNANKSGGVIIDPSEQWIFETDSVRGEVSTFGKIGAFWSLLTYTPSPGSLITTFPAGAGAGPMAIDPAARFLYVANQTANSISAFQYFGTSPELLEATGIFISPHTSGSPFSIGAKPIALATDFSTPFLYVVCDDDTLRVYEMDYAGGGYIAQAASLKLAGLPVGVAAEPGGRFVYAATAGAVSGFSVDYGSGVLTPLASSIAIPSQIFGLYAEPSGKFLYVGTVAGVLGYSINADGTLTAISSVPLATPTQPSSMSVSVGIE